MDHYFCVVDAPTLIENVQEIKHLVHQGRIRLVVPQCTSASLEQIYAKFKEDANKKPVRQVEPQRPRAGGKPTRIEPPAFDINPLVAGELLNRLRSKDGETKLEFQKDSEQYSPWKFLEQEEERSNVTESKPSTFAQAVQKQNIERLLNSSGSANGPGKARLVAKAAGLEGSPWKANTKALSLPISEVPKETRPLLSCVLWRLHEKGATRWDTDRTILLCDDAQTCATAKKVGISTKSMKELRRVCKAVADDNREVHGSLEEDFGLADVVRIPSQDHSRQDQKEVSVSITLQEPIMDQVDAKPVEAPVQASVAGSSSSTEHTASVSSAKSSGSGKENAAPEKSQSQSSSRISDNLNGIEQTSEEVSKSLPEEHHNETDLLQPSCSTKKVTPTEVALEDSQGEAQGKAPVFSTLDLEKEHSIADWLRGLTNAAKNNELTGRDSPMSRHSSTADLTMGGQPEHPKPFKPLTYRQAVTGKADQVPKRPTPPPPKEILPSPRVSPVRDPSPPKLELSGDSSEEIVFNPKAKRLSAQKPQPDQSLQTPTASPKVSHVRQASGGHPRGRNGSQRPPRAGPPPVVIDPDSFGRNLPASAQPTPARTFNPYGPGGRTVNGRRGNHRPQNPRPHAQNAAPKTNGVVVTNESASTDIQPVKERLPNTSVPVNVERAPKAQTPAPVNPPAILKPSPPINGAPNEGPPSGPSLAVQGSQIVTGAALRPEKPRYSPRGSPRSIPVTPDPDVGYILRTGKPREATRGRGKLWVP
ncbi:MAG: hypothetical protein LQ350_005853 [Teloschistes chrysophthalmus]|nr:MAG: hypothetical protein LQ350_005853 [Niorma chrysophthalma]